MYVKNAISSWWKTACFIHLFSFIAAKKTQGKSKEEAQKEKKQELEKRLQDVSGQLGGQFNKKNAKKGKHLT